MSAPLQYSTIVEEFPDEEVSTANAPVRVHWAKFAFVSYLIVCGGPWGMEQAVQAGYPLYTLFFIILVPIIWNIPIALVTAELGSALPSNEGAFIWIREAWGPHVAFVYSITYWLNYAVDTGLYPVLMVGYFQELGTVFTPEWVGIVFSLSVILLVFALNVLGIDLLANVSTAVTVIQNIPILICVIMSMYRGTFRPSVWVEVPPGPLDFDGLIKISLCFQIIMWSNSGYDAMGSMVEEIKNPNKNMIKSLALACFMSTFTYFICICTFVGVDTNYDLWVDGYFSVLASRLVGKWFLYYTIVSALIGTFGTFNALLFPCSQQLWALGGPQFLDIPMLNYKLPRFNTPIVALVINAIICVVFTFVPFITLVQLNNLLYGLLVLLILTSMVKLRFSEHGKRLPRPFKMAESNGMVIFALIWPLLVCFFVIGTAAYNARLMALVVLGVLVALVMLNFACQYRKRRWGVVERED